jgi:ribosomal protein S12 methylthiotransferase accessory factor
MAAHPGVGYGGADAVKRYRVGTHRTATPDETLARVGPFTGQMGITRVANVTGLDRVGLPVVMVCRPNSRSLAVAQGKGIDLPAAKASGLMEAVETFHAESITAPLLLGTWRDLGRTHPLVNVDRLPRSRVGPCDPDRLLLWIEGRDLISGLSRWVPYECVHTDYTLPPGPAAGAFPANTNGLASGNHLLEAVCHGLCEVVERDAITLWKHAGERARQRTAIDLATVDDPLCRAVLDSFARAHLTVRVWDVMSDVGIACFYCLVVGQGDDPADPELGSGCHPAREVALLRALTEAAQARITYITGARDDFSADDYSPRGRARRWRECQAVLQGSPPQRDFRAVPTWATERLDEDVAWMLERLRAVGSQEVVVVDLTKAEFDIPVARVLVPGLEGPDKGDRVDYAPGPRALAARGGSTPVPPAATAGPVRGRKPEAVGWSSGAPPGDGVQP